MAATNILAVMQQLREAQERARNAEARCSALEHDNSLLLNEVQVLRGAKFSDGADVLLSELQRQLSEVLKRNAVLEGATHTNHSTLRHQYEAQIESLEIELRRGRSMMQKSTTTPQRAAPNSTRKDIL